MKSKEELEKEQQQAKEQLEQLLQAGRPKNFRQGAATGVSNILAGALGGAGVAVLGPTAGLAMGLQKGGIIGGAVGVVGGAVVGAVGAVALIVGGAVSGVTQILRGVAAVPQAVMAPRQGKWWNANQHEWVYTDLNKMAGTIPDNDDDLLKGIEDELDAASRPTEGGDDNVKDTYYYDVLEVDTKAEPSAIKRRYYVLARQYHPDKVSDPAERVEAEKKFKEIAEAYQVLGDPELREKYNRDGKDALSGDKTSGADDQKADPTLILAFLFGSDQFNDYIGRLATSTSAMLGDSTRLSLQDARTLQARRVARLAIKLVSKIELWVQEDYEMCKTLWKTEMEALSQASYGYELLKLLGMVSLQKSRLVYSDSLVSSWILGIFV